MTLNALRAGCAVIAIFAASNAFAAAQCTSDVRVLAQPRDGLTLLEKYVDEFEELSGAGFEISYLNENDRRAKSQADASTVGSFNVYYVDEANLALFASSKWIVPLEGFYPAEYDYKDFDAGMRAAATYDGKEWFAPVQGGGDLMVYRTDLLEKAGITPPKTWDDYFAAVKKLHDPANGVYGTALRGQRGSGANVWRWMPFFKANGGEWFKDGKPAFNSDAAVKATETYLELFKYSAPAPKRAPGMSPPALSAPARWRSSSSLRRSVACRSIRRRARLQTRSPSRFHRRRCRALGTPMVLQSLPRPTRPTRIRPAPASSLPGRHPRNRRHAASPPVSRGVDAYKHLSEP